MKTHGLQSADAAVEEFLLNGVYLGDLVSAERDYKDVEKMRRLVYTDLNEAMLYALTFSIKAVLKKKGLIPPCTIDGYNFYTALLKQDEKPDRGKKKDNN